MANQKIKILIADTSFLARQGLKAIIAGTRQFSLAGEVLEAGDLDEQLMLTHPELLILDYTSAGFHLGNVRTIRKNFPRINILAITSSQPRQEFSKALDRGVTSHVLKSCAKKEIIEAIKLTGAGKRFLCKDIMEAVNKNQVRPVACHLGMETKISHKDPEITRLTGDDISLPMRYDLRQSLISHPLSLT